MSRKGQKGIVGFIFYLAVFILLWAFFIADLLTWVGQNALAGGNITGVELFIMTNLNLVVLVCVIISLGLFTAYAGSKA